MNRPDEGHSPLEDLELCTASDWGSSVVSGPAPPTCALDNPVPRPGADLPTLLLQDAGCPRYPGNRDATSGEGREEGEEEMVHALSPGIKS